MIPVDKFMGLDQGTRLGYGSYISSSDDVTICNRKLIKTAEPLTKKADPQTDKSLSDVFDLLRPLKKSKTLLQVNHYKWKEEEIRSRFKIPGFEPPQRVIDRIILLEGLF
tara:strand:- start:1788 stop:2117 length:330 start_codon:yes stop_codon:yes gene_type:complete